MKTHTDIRRFIDIFRVKWRLRSYGLVGTMLILFTLLAVPRPAAACSALNPFCWAGELVDYVWDDLRDLKSLTWDVVTLNYRDVWKDVRTIVDNQIGFVGLGYFILGTNAFEWYFADCGSSHSIDADTLSSLSLYFKSDLRSVRIHERCGRLGSSRAATTFGEDIYFNNGKYAPSTPEGFATLAHELTHVLQYRRKGFADFAYEYISSCLPDDWSRNASGICGIEAQAYKYEDLVLDDQHADRDGQFQQVDNCPFRFNPGKEDVNKNGVGDVCEVPTYVADVTGDGRADAIAVSRDGIVVQTSNGTTLANGRSIPGTGFIGAAGSTTFADVNGDGIADAIAVHEDGVWVRLANRSAGFDKAVNWSHGPYYGSKDTYFADVTGDGKADAIVVWDSGIHVRPSTGFDFPVALQAQWSGAAYGVRGTFFADVTGDGKADAIVVQNTGMFVLASTGSQFAGPFTDWTGGAFYGNVNTLFIDVTGDGKADAVAVSSSGVWVRASNGTAFGKATNWTRNLDPLGLTTPLSQWSFGDINGDHRADAIRLFGAYVGVATSTGSEFAAVANDAQLNPAFASTWSRRRCPAPSPEQVAIYQHASFGGNCRVLDVGMYPHSDSFSPVPNDAVSSIELGTNVQVSLYQHGGYGGKVIDLDGGQSYPHLSNYDFNDRASGMKVFRK